MSTNNINDSHRIDAHYDVAYETDDGDTSHTNAIATKNSNVNKHTTSDANTIAATAANTKTANTIVDEHEYIDGYYD